MKFYLTTETFDTHIRPYIDLNSHTQIYTCIQKYTYALIILDNIITYNTLIYYQEALWIHATSEANFMNCKLYYFHMLYLPFQLKPKTIKFGLNIFFN